MIWHGLFHCYCLDAERENDGDFLNTLWKLSMIGLWNDNHNISYTGTPNSSR